jgi:glycine cleavage system aminomethyltransferase T
VASILSRAGLEEIAVSAILPATIPMSRALSRYDRPRCRLQDHIEIFGHWLIHRKAKATCVVIGGLSTNRKSQSRRLNERAGMSLADRGVIEVVGADATGFLQRLVTNSVLNIPKGEGRYAGL